MPGTVGGGAETAISAPPTRKQRRVSRQRRERTAARLSNMFSDAALGCGLGHYEPTAAGIPHTALPQVTHVEFDDQDCPVWLLVRLRGGQVIEDLRAASERLAECLGVGRIAIEPRTTSWARVLLNPADPLASDVDRPGRVATVRDPVTFGQLESGELFTWSLVDCTHLVIQGASGSGKSVFSYNILGQLVDTPDVVIAGSDPSGLLLQPWAEVFSGWHALGLDSLEMHAVILERLVTIMDQRIAAMPLGQDQVVISPDCPLILGVLEEFPGLIRHAQRHDDGLARNQAHRKVLPRIQQSYGRLMSEGRKAGLRLLIITQRADSDFLGGYERGQARLRFSFAVDTADALRMLHPHSAAEHREQHMAAPPGISLVTAPGIPLARMRGPARYEYADYCTAVTNGAMTSKNDPPAIELAA